MRKNSHRTLLFDIATVEFTQAPDDGPVAVAQRLRNLIKIAIEIQTKGGLIGNRDETSITQAVPGQNSTQCLESEEKRQSKKIIRNI
jgi:hypothetical protein